MLTYTGQSIWPPDSPHYDPDAVPDIDAIAVGLGRQVRWAGSTIETYTVLPHSFVVSQIVDPRYRVAALLHDAHESIVGDTPSNWKTDAQRELEAHLDALIFAEFDVVYDERARVAVKLADLAALAAEAHVLGREDAEHWWPQHRFGALENRALAATERMLDRGVVELWMFQPDMAMQAMREQLTWARTTELEARA